MHDLGQRRAEAVRSIGRLGLLTDHEPLCGIIDLTTMEQQVEALREAFASRSPVMHTVAVKAVGLRPLLKALVELGIGCEVASPGELALAQAVKCPPERIVFDSPAKTRQDIRTAIALGISMNLDNLAELARVDAALDGSPPSAHIGVRINPQSGAGTIDAMSTATRTSKFGIGVRDQHSRAAVIDAYLARPWLTQLHVHSGSQGIALEQAADGVARAVKLAEEINSIAGRKQVQRIDIGGGLPVNFDTDEHSPAHRDYRRALEAAAPALFDGSYELVTEFGRSLLAKSGTIVSRVEYVKETGGARIAVAHAGVQVAVRTVFNRADWPLRVLVHDAHGTRKETAPIPHDIAGPACFAGDVLARGMPLPAIEPGDIIAVPDTGAYYFSHHFSYNALPRPAVHAYRVTEPDGCRWFHIRSAQTISDVVADAGHTDLVPVPPPVAPKHPAQGDVPDARITAY